MLTDNFNNIRNPNVYSAEMTALLRCSYPNISKDFMSQFLVSSLGIRDTLQFLTNFNYPLMSRVISVRAGFFLSESVRLLNTEQYDACISIASGFSLLTHLISQFTPKSISFLDCDLQEILEERQLRIQAHPLLRSKKIKHNYLYQLDIINMAKKNISIKSLLPEYKNPLFIIEGLSYFLSKQTMFWLLNEISAYKQASLIADFCSTDSLQSHSCLGRLMTRIPGFLSQGEAMYRMIEQNFNLLHNFFNKVIYYDIAEAEKIMSNKDDKTVFLNNQDDFIPTKILVAQ